MTNEPLFLISPPGSLEASEMGYFNVPKIFQDPPSKLKEIYEYTDNTGLLEYPQESNFWVFRKQIELKKAAFDLIIPIFPKILRYAVPWIVCEYGLYCTENDNPASLKLFIQNTLKRRTPDYVIAELLWGKRWRGSEIEMPIWYLKGALNQIYGRQKQKKRKQSDYLSYEGPKKRHKTEDYESLFGDPKILSINEPVITGDPLIASSDGKDLRPENILGKKNYEINEMEISKLLTESCNAANFSENAKQLLMTQIFNATSKADAATSLEYSDEKYESTRREINRKIPLLREQISILCPSVLSQRATSD